MNAVQPLLQYHKLHCPDLKAGSNENRFQKQLEAKMFSNSNATSLALVSSTQKWNIWKRWFLAPYFLNHLTWHYIVTLLIYLFPPNLCLNCKHHNCYKNSNNTPIKMLKKKKRIQTVQKDVTWKIKVSTITIIPLLRGNGGLQIFYFQTFSVINYNFHF